MSEKREIGKLSDGAVRFYLDLLEETAPVVVSKKMVPTALALVRLALARWVLVNIKGRKGVMRLVSLSIAEKERDEYMKAIKRIYLKA